MKKGCAVVAVVLVVLLGLAFLVYRNGVHPGVVLWIVKQSWDRTEDLDARVEGEVEIMGFDVAGAGRLRFRKPGLYDLDFQTARVIAGSDVLWVVVPAFRTGVRVTSDSMTPAEVLYAIVSGWESHDPTRWVDEATADPTEVKLYAPKEIDGERCWVLQWPSRTGERVGGRLYVSQRTRAPTRFDEMDSAGRVIRTFRVTDFKRNVGLGPADFGYEPMSGYFTFDYRFDPQDPMAISRVLRSGGGQGGGNAERHLPEKATEYLRRKGF